jgi:hypothetical protein
MWDPTIPQQGQNSCRAASVNQQGQAVPSTCSSIPVPLGYVTWHWSGDAINTLANQATGTTYILPCAPGVLQGFVASSLYPPRWESVAPSVALGNWACSSE